MGPMGKRTAAADDDGKDEDFWCPVVDVVYIGIKPLCNLQMERIVDTDELDD